MLIRILHIVFTSLLAVTCSAQYNWKLEKDQQGIKVYSSEIRQSSFKAIKVECVLSGNYKKLISILTNVPEMHKWIYKAKPARLIKQVSPLDIIYLTETETPWPLSNRDAVIHLKINTDSLPKYLLISGRNENNLVAKIPGKVRVNNYKADWRVSMPTAKTLQIHYIIELDPGGDIPGWISNSFISKGPFETFSNLAKKLKQ